MLINRLTGEEATPKELEACKYQAQRILDSPYSSPEQIAWAMQFPGVVIPQWESCREAAICRRHEALPHNNSLEPTEGPPETGES